MIAMEGANNFRDMGGYRSIDGRKVKHGLFYRSDELTGLSEQDLVRLRELNIKTIFDYRDDYEAAGKPDPEVDHAALIRVPAIQEGQQAKMNFPSQPEGGESGGHMIEQLLKSGFLQSFRAEEMMMELYAKLPIGNPSYKRLMALVQQPERLGLLHHCTAGKDRTGVGAALILLALGVPEETVMEDYMLTNVTMKAFNEKLLDRLAGRVEESVLRNMEELLGVREAFLEAALDSVKESYGHYDIYFAEEFGLTKTVRESLKNSCLE